MSCKSEYHLTKRMAEPSLKLNTKYNRKHKTERRLTSSGQTASTQSHCYVIPVWKVRTCWFGRRTL